MKALHEMMISSDDARNTVDLGDRYAIEPDFVEYPRKSFRKDGHTPAPDWITELQAPVEPTS